MAPLHVRFGDSPTVVVPPGETRIVGYDMPDYLTEIVMRCATDDSGGSIVSRHYIDEENREIVLRDQEDANITPDRMNLIAVLTRDSRTRHNLGLFILSAHHYDSAIK